jgi:hypothetical protein
MTGAGRDRRAAATISRHDRFVMIGSGSAIATQPRPPLAHRTFHDDVDGLAAACRIPTASAHPPHVTD